MHSTYVDGILGKHDHLQHELVLEAGLGTLFNHLFTCACEFSFEFQI
jgi:hypothetical protein